MFKARRLRVGIDARMIQHSGIGTYLGNLIQNFPSLNAAGFKFALFGPPELLPAVNGFYQIEDFKDPIYSVSEQISFFSKTASTDLWHAPHYNVPLWCRSRLVVTIHDVIPLIFQGVFFSKTQKFYLETMLRHVKRHASRIIAVSQNTKNDLIRLFQIPDHRIRVIHEGAGEIFHPIESEEEKETVRRRYGLPREGFILYVGLLKPHKNLKILLQAVRQLQERGKIREKLVLAGSRSKNCPPDARYLETIQTDERVICLNKMEASELPILYSLATVFVLPSLYEGFGLPVLEAFACGTPVIVSNRASLPEVAADAALSFNPESVDELCEAILKLIEDPQLRQEMREKGFRRVQCFSWKKAARETLEVYKEILEMP